MISIPSLRTILSLFAVLCIAGVVGILFTLHVPAVRAVECVVYTSGQVPTGFGAAYNPFSSMTDTLLRSICNTDELLPVVRSDTAAPIAVYRTGYHWLNGTWSPFTFEPDGGVVSGEYILGSAKAAEALAYEGRYTHWIAYVCVWQNSTWKCGCNDVSCRVPLWNFQTTVRPTDNARNVISGSSGTSRSTGSNRNTNAAGSWGSSDSSSNAGQSDTPDETRVNAQMCEVPVMDTVTNGTRVQVSNAAQLKSALASARPGDVVQLQPGSYGWVELKDLPYADFVTLRGTEGVILKHLGLWNVNNLHIENVRFEYGDATGQTWKPKMIEMRNARNIRIVNNTFVGNPNAVLYGEEMPDTGIRAYGGSRNITIVNNRMSKIMRAVMMQQVDTYVIEHNHLFDIGCDGLFFQNSSNGQITNNLMERFRPFIYAAQGSTCHGDFVQFDAGKGRNTMRPSYNVTVQGNVMLQGENGSRCDGPGDECGAMQGIFFEGAVGALSDGTEHLFEDIIISNNVYCASGINGLYINNSRDSKIIHNAHFTCPPPFGATHLSNINLRNIAINGEVEGNTTGRVADQAEAIALAKEIEGLDNCRIQEL